MVSGSTQKLIIFLLVLAIVYPFLAYAWASQFQVSGYSLPSGITEGSLMQAGIVFSDAESENVTETDTWFTFSLTDFTYRVKWTGDLFYWQRANTLFNFIWYNLNPSPYNETWIIGNYSSTLNFTEIAIDVGYSAEATCLVSIHPNYTTIEDSVGNGTITMMIGRSVEQISSGNWYDMFPRAIGWFTGSMVSGYVAPVTGLDIIISIINTIIIVLGVMAIIFLVRGI